MVQIDLIAVFQDRFFNEKGVGNQPDLQEALLIQSCVKNTRWNNVTKAREVLEILRQIIASPLDRHDDGVLEPLVDSVIHIAEQVGRLKEILGGS